MSFDPGLLLARVPLELMVPIAVLMSVTVSLTGIWIARRVATPRTLADNVIVGMILSDVTAVVYAVSLALVLIGAFSHFTFAQTAAQREAATLETLIRTADAFDQTDQSMERARMKAAVRDYARAVVEWEWDYVGRGGGSGSEHVALRLRELAHAFVMIEPETARQQVLHQNVVNWIREVGELRGFRLTTVSRTLAAMIWAVALAGLSLSVLLPLLMGGSHIVVHGAMSASLTFFLVLYLLAAVHLAYPYTGDTGLSPAALVALAG